jgi:hypothetical protein
MSVFFLLLFLFPVVALGWRVVVSKTRIPALRVGGAAAAMITLVGAFDVFDELADFDFNDWRSDVALLAAVSGSVYLIGWSLGASGNRQHRTTSIIAAIIGLVPVVGAVVSTLLFGGQG